MKIRARRTTRVAGLLLLLAAEGISLQASEWRVGDVVVAVGNGQYKVYDNGGNFKETITDSQGNGFTTGCAFDSSFHLYTTNFTNTKVVKFSIPHPHGVLQTIDTAVASPGGESESIVFDGSGNFYVGHPDGNHFVHKYNAAGVLQQTFAVAIEEGGLGSDWIDLASDQTTLFYTSEGRKIKRFNVSGIGTQLSDFATLPTPDSGPVPKAFALRLLPPGDGSGGLLVADSVNIKRLNGSGNVVQTYTAAGESHWFALNLDPNGTSFWAGDDTSNNFYRFNISTGAIEVGPVNINVSGDLTGLFGICVDGGFSAAQPSPTVQTLTLTPGNNSGTVSNPGNAFSITLPGLTQTVNLKVSFLAIDPSAGVSESGRPCELTSADGTKCTIHHIQATLADGSAIEGLPAHLYHHWDFKPPGTINPRMIESGKNDITTFVVLDPGDAGDPICFSPFSDNEAPAPTGTSCGFLPPVTDGAVFPLPRTIPFKFQATATGGDCSGGPFMTTLIPRISIALLPDSVPQTVEFSGDSGTPNFFRLDDDGRTWIVNLSTQHLPSGDYAVSVFDQSNQIPAFSVRISLR